MPNRPRSEPLIVAYRALKRALADPERAVGSQIIVTELAETLGLSATPIREAIARLVGEGLVEDRRRQGYFVPRLNEMRVADLYWLQDICLRAGLCRAPKHQAAGQGVLTDTHDAGDIGCLCRSIAARSGSAILAAIVENLNDRLAPYRRAEEEIVDSAVRDALVLAVKTADNAVLAKTVQRYFRICFQSAALIVAKREAAQI